METKIIGKQSTPDGSSSGFHFDELLKEIDSIIRKYRTENKYSSYCDFKASFLNLVTERLDRMPWNFSDTPTA